MIGSVEALNPSAAIDFQLSNKETTNNFAMRLLLLKKTRNLSDRCRRYSHNISISVSVEVQ